MKKTGDIVVFKQTFANSVRGIYGDIGIIVETFDKTCNVRLIIGDYEISTLYKNIEKVYFGTVSNYSFKIGDLVQLKEEVRTLINIPDHGIILEKTSIRTDDLHDEDIAEIIDAFVIFFPNISTEYTIPKNCVEFFGNKKQKN
jgi:hypothetical protein